MTRKNLTIRIENTSIHAIQVGKGKQHLIMIPGLGDSLTTVKGLALPFSFLYRNYGKHFRVTVLSRRNQMNKSHGTKEMADDIRYAMEQLNIDKADVLGISQGGMIAQHLASEHPEKVNRLVLAVSAPNGNPMICKCIDRWVNMIQKDDYLSFMKDNLVSMYSKDYCRKYLWMIHITGRMKPKSFERFYVMAEACRNHDALDCLSEIKCPVLILAGKMDQIVGVDASYLLKEKIAQAKLIVYPEYGHAVYDEEKRFHQDVLDFLKEND